MKRVLGGVCRPWIRLQLGWWVVFFSDKRDQFESNFMQTNFNNSCVFIFEKFARSVKNWKRLFRMGKSVNYRRKFYTGADQGKYIYGSCCFFLGGIPHQVRIFRGDLCWGEGGGLFKTPDIPRAGYFKCVQMKSNTFPKGKVQVVGI